jgi:hypothetical protein
MADKQSEPLWADIGAFMAGVFEVDQSDYSVLAVIHDFLPVFGLCILAGILIAIYILPWRIAVWKHKRLAPMIGVLNVFFGWTIRRLVYPVRLGHHQRSGLTRLQPRWSVGFVKGLAQS